MSTTSAYYVFTDVHSYTTQDIAEKEALSRTRATGVSNIVCKSISMAVPVRFEAKIERLPE